jgi:ankyrin repeat protein
LSLQYKDPIKLKPKVKFTDELIFLENVKDKDVDSLRIMLRRASLQVDINKINSKNGLTPLHQAVLENSIDLVRLLLDNKARVNTFDSDSWTPLHAACAIGNYEIAR